VRNYPVQELQRYERELLEFMRARHGDLLETIRKTGKLEDDAERKLAAALDEFGGMFQPSEEGRSAA